MNLNRMIPILINNALGKKAASDDLQKVAQDLWNIAMELPKDQPLFKEIMEHRDQTLKMSERLLFDIDHHVAIG